MDDYGWTLATDKLPSKHGWNADFQPLTPVFQSYTGKATLEVIAYLAPEISLGLSFLPGLNCKSLSYRCLIQNAKLHQRDLIGMPS